MRDRIHVIRRFIEDRRGATAIEYTIIACCIFFGIVAAVTSLGTTLAGIFPVITAAMQ